MATAQPGSDAGPSPASLPSRPAGPRCITPGYCPPFRRDLRLQLLVVTFLEHLVEFLLVVTLFGLAVLAIAFFVARSYVRRHWRVLRGHVVTRGLVSGLSFLSAGRERW